MIQLPHVLFLRVNMTMEKPEKKKRFKNETLCFNPFSELVEKVAPVDRTIADKGNPISSVSEDTGSTDRDTMEPLSAKSVVSMRIERKGRGGENGHFSNGLSNSWHVPPEDPPSFTQKISWLWSFNGK